MKRSMNPGFAGIDNELYLDPKTTMLFGDAKESVLKLISAVKSRDPGLPSVRRRRAVSPHEAYDAVRGAFDAHARGTWSMPSKVYVTNYPAGDFRAMPAIGDGHAVLKWVTSFPGNPRAACRR